MSVDLSDMRKSACESSVGRVSCALVGKSDVGETGSTSCLLPVLGESGGWRNIDWRQNYGESENDVWVQESVRQKKMRRKMIYEKKETCFYALDEQLMCQCQQRYMGK